MISRVSELTPPVDPHRHAALLPVRMDTTAFVGEHPTGPRLSPLVIHRWSEYAEAFGRASGRSWLTDAVRGFFANGGSSAVVCSIGEPVSERDRLTRHLQALALLEDHRDIAFVCAPGRTEPAIHEALLIHCESSRTRLALIDGPREVEAGSLLQLHRPADSVSGVFLFPWLLTWDAEWGRGLVPCSGHVAGIQARVERERGVHRPVEGEIVRGVVGLSTVVPRASTELLTARGINCLRDCGDRGVRLQGGLTLARSRVTVHRIAAMIERTIESCAQAEMTSVLDRPPAERIQESAEEFLIALRDRGVLVGPVSVSLETEPTSPEEGDVLSGELRFTPAGGPEFSVRIALPALTEPAPRRSCS